MMSYVRPFFPLRPYLPRYKNQIDELGLSNVRYLSPKLCSQCARALQSSGEGVLFDANKASEKTPKACPLCAHEEFFQSIYLKEFDKIEFQVEESAGGNFYLHLRYHFDDDVENELLEILPLTFSIKKPHNARDLPNKTWSPESITFLKEKMEECLLLHNKCRSASIKPPTRLLRIGNLSSSGWVQNGLIYLANGDEAATYKYVTLSHCWGSICPTELTKATEKDFRAGISIEALPKTFRHAIQVCQELDQHYLWIDSLCIFQDNHEDWAMEAANMHSVYANALCNIAATGAADSSEGLFFDRNPLAHQPFVIRTGTLGRKKWVCLPDWSQYTISEAPLNRRAWVAQERFLSNRVMHFTRTGIYWDCQEAKFSEMYTANGEYVNIYAFDDDSALKDSTRVPVPDAAIWTPTSKTDADHHYQSWLNLVARYSACGLTKEEDKLIAFNGIVQRMKESMGATIMCGLWTQYIQQELQWEVRKLFNRVDAPLLQEWRAPSWSWASGDHHVNEFPFWSRHRYCDALQYIIDVPDIDVKSLPTGKVESGRLVLRSNIVRATIRMERHIWLRSFPAIVDCKNGQHVIDNRAFVFDRLPPFPHEEELTIVALSRCHCKETNGGTYEINSKLGSGVKKPRPSIVALLLRRLPTDPPTYGRAGVLRLQSEECKLYDENVSSTREELVVV